jgi:hypothetical protein
MASGINNTNTNNNTNTTSSHEIQLHLQSASYGLLFYNNEFINYIKNYDKIMKYYDYGTKQLLLKLKKIGNVKKIYDKFTITTKIVPLCLEKLIFNTHICVKLDKFHLIMCSHLGCGFNFTLYNYELYEINNESNSNESNSNESNSNESNSNESNSDESNSDSDNEQLYFIKYKNLVSNGNGNSKTMLIFHGDRMFMYF